MDDEEARTRLLDAAETLFYADGIQAVGMDRIRAESGVPLKRLYRVFPAKESLVTAYLERRDRRWMTSLREAVTQAPERPVAAVFDWLARWFSEPDFRGCAFLNAYGELGTGPEAVLDVIRRHKSELRALLGELAGPGQDALADQLLILVEGAMVVAALTPGPDPALRAGEAASVLIGERRTEPPEQRHGDGYGNEEVHGDAS
ncbi:MULTISPECIES: TetR/AcrR family transcriptional regulator [unclassified Streptomyces]|uniref:TetR/AcrR family transcriptional regulator n=1 Tax=unclassified Streptomyces TaxID=2593676 RepID=UPI001BE83B78|nr:MULTISPECIES: TetR/AcrR family transcriptional regulator [unclassified Streptomyces]MBT2404735.1 TetR/AcrR family transcriptional regulator [Streptomyces sp. ISL-21]MBT2458336.1 TetR/AcrR family transcriptional regulator [Streptomyces sp. ISL-86]MBT2612617.1 TetR/AcrR family transcriptional regulator [Streptomyces sp. ISL-87]